MRISDWSSDVCSSDLQMRPLQAKMRIGLVGHADPAVNLDIGAAIVERRLVGEPFRGGDMERRTGIARIERAGGIIELRPRDRSEEYTSELKSLMRQSYAVFCLK